MNLRQHKRRAIRGMKIRQDGIARDPEGFRLISEGGRRLLTWAFCSFTDSTRPPEFKCLDGVSVFRGHIYSRY